MPSTPKPKYVLCVFYGCDKRWDHALLQHVQNILGRECRGLDGLQADFVFNNYDDAIRALFIVRGINVRAQVGNIGKECTKEALNEARRVMQENYRSENEKS